MNFTGRLRRLGSLFDGPGAGLVLARRQEADEAQELVARGNQLVKTGSGDAEGLEVVGLFALVKGGNLFFNLGGDTEHLAPMCRGIVPNRCDMRIGSAVVREILLLHIGRINHGLCGQKAERGDKACAVVVLRFVGGGGLSVLEQGLQLLQNFELLL